MSTTEPHATFLIKVACILLAMFSFCEMNLTSNVGKKQEKSVRNGTVSCKEKNLHHLQSVLPIPAKVGVLKLISEWVTSPLKMFW